MKTNKYGTPGQRITRIVICLIIIIAVALLNGAGKKFYLSQYQEECYVYKTEEVTTRICSGYLFNLTFENKTNEVCSTWGGGTGWMNMTNIKFTDRCLKYHLVRLPDGTLQ